MMRNGMLILAIAAGLVNAEPITYQGQLFVDGLPAAGTFDLECRLFDAVVDGLQLGQTVVVDDHVVPNGLLNVELDFGDAFDSTNTYIEISMRLGDTEDVFDVLSPRQHITPTPKAIHATTADTIAGPGWTSSDANTIWFGGGDDRVLINREQTINPVEYFGVHIENSPIGGIVVSNADANGDSLYAYAAGGAIGASHSFDGEMNIWSLVIGTDFVLTADSGGISSPSFNYSSSKTQAVTVSGDVFHSSLGTPFRASFFGGGAYLSTPGANDPMVAPISLPHGAKITKLVARFEDNAASDISITLNGATSDGNLIAIASVNTEGIAPFIGIQSLDTTEIEAAGEVVNAFSTGYYIRVFSSSWPGDSSMRIWSVTVEYTVDAPN